MFKSLYDPSSPHNLQLDLSMFGPARHLPTQEGRKGDFHMLSRRAFCRALCRAGFLPPPLPVLSGSQAVKAHGE